MNDKQKRPAPTIDLTATEVAKASADEKAPSAAEPEQQMDESTAEPNTTLPPEEQHEENTPPPSRSGSIGASLAAGFAGAVFATAVLAALWFAGLLPIQLQTPTEQSVQIANMQKQIEQLQARPAPAGDKVALDTLRQRLSKLESDIAVLPSGDKAVAGRLVESDKTIKSLGAQIAALNKRRDRQQSRERFADQRAECHAANVRGRFDRAQCVERARRCAGASSSRVAREGGQGI
jgi:hypothetical protein